MFAKLVSQISSLFRGQLFRHFVMMLSGSVVARAVILLAMPILSRLYTPESIGLWQLFVSLFLVVASLVSWRYELAIMLPEKEDDAASVFWVCTFSSIAMSLFWGTLIQLLADPITRLLGDAQLREHLWLVPLLCLAFGLEQACAYWLTRHKEFHILSPIRVLRALAIVGVPLTAAWLAQGDVIHLISGTVSGYLAVSIALCAYVAITSLGRLRRGLSWQNLSTVAFRYRNYPLFVAPYQFVAQFSLRLLLFLLAIYATTHVVGQVAMAMQLTNVPVAFVSLALSQVFYPKIARELKDGLLEPFVERVLTMLVIAATPPFVLFAFYAPNIFGFVLDERWREAGEFASYLAGASLVVFLAAWLNRIYDVTGRQRLEITLQLSYNVTTLSLLLFLLSRGASPMTAVITYCLATALYNTIWLSVGFRVAGFTLKALARPAGYWLLLGGGVLAICWAATRLLPSGYSAAGAVPITVLLQVAIAYNWQKADHEFNTAME